LASGTNLDEAPISHRLLDYTIGAHGEPVVITETGVRQHVIDYAARQTGTLGLWSHNEPADDTKRAVYVRHVLSI
jgi:hypothetical protein